MPGKGASSMAAVAFGAALLVSACNSATGPTDAGPDSRPQAQVCLPLDAGLPVVAVWTGVDAGPGGEPLASFADDYYTAFCDGWSRCYPFEGYLVAACVEQLQATGAWTAPTQCLPVPSLGGTSCEAQGADLSGVAAHVAAVGTELSYDAQAAAACLAAPWTFCLPLAQQALEPGACAAVFSPLVPDGGACGFDLACINGTCALQDNTCSGMCVPAAAPTPDQPGRGDYCLNGAGCGDAGLLCDGVYCRLDAGVGASCLAGGAFFDCAPGLYCAIDAGTCQPQLPQGGSCVFNPALLGADLTAQCQPGLGCQREALLTDGGLRPGSCEAPARLGQSCSNLQSDEIVNRSGCMTGAVCSCSVCVPPPVSGPCADDWAPCRPGVSACDYVDAGTCLPLSDFPTCWNGQQCATGYCGAGICAPTPVEACPG